MQTLSKKALFLSFVLAAMSAAWILVPEAGRANSTETSRKVRFGMAALPRLQTARLNVVNLYPLGNQAEPCVAMLGFKDSAGNDFFDRSGAPISSNVSLLPQTAAFLELRDSDAFRGVTGQRVPFRATVEFQPTYPTAPVDHCIKAVATLDIYDVFTGRSSILYQPPDIAIVGNNVSSIDQ